MRTFFTVFLTLATGAAAADSQPSADALVGLKGWLAKPAGKRAPLADAAFGTVALTKQDAEAAAGLLWKDHSELIRKERADEMKEEGITIGKHTMKFRSVRFGPAEAPTGGRSLFISMHGGGNAPAQVNDQQWENQIALAQGYKPAEGIYVAPRAPTNSWNLWHEAHIDLFFARIVENLIVQENVNPDRVYIMGYSAGGDGVYQLAPRMADWWAAAAMMAGHPNETQPAGLRNVPFALQVGEKDGGFDRNKIAAQWTTKLDDLQKADPGGYVHMVELHKGRGHWMNLDDRKAIPWMEKYSRNPFPERIVWRQDDVTHNRFYWLAAAPGTAKGGTEVTADRKAQTITLSSSPAGLTVLLNDAMLDMDMPVTVRSGDKEIFNAVPSRTIKTLARTLSERGDPKLIFSAEIPTDKP